MSKKKQGKTKTTEKKVKITPAKGRPMLHWVGKRPLSELVAFPAQHIETFDPVKSGNISQNLLFHGDNKEVLAFLLAKGYRGRINLIYIDPPFDSGADYVRRVNLRGQKGQAKIDGENYALGEQIQYTDIWANDNYLQFMYERLLLLKELLEENGSIYLHSGWHKNHHLRCILDEIFGSGNLRNEIVWYYEDKFATGGKSLDKNHDLIFHYSKGDVFTGNEIRIEKDKKTKRALRKKVSGHTIDVLNENGEKIIVEYTDKIIDDVWQIGRSIPNNEYLGYPTQKKDDLIRRILEYGSNCDDLIFDCFIGSGTTAAVAQKLGRRWIGCDINKGAIQTTSKRLQTIILRQIKEAKKKQPQLFFDYEGETEFHGPLAEVDPPVSALAFSVWRVNDYDLQIQHNEAVNLVCEHIGIEKKKTDVFFDGILGRKLVKIIPFNHPLSPIDLGEIRNELESRPEEDRSITVVCLGMELGAKAWVEKWNRLRKGKNAVNRIEVIELRSDAKYGGFIKHESAKAEVKFRRKKDKVEVEIEDFISPTIITRLQQQAGLLQPKIDDWRSMVDCVMIDTNYDGKIFNIVLSDVPEKKTDLVIGKYEIEGTGANSLIAVKIIDMLGEEVLVTKTI